MNTMRANRTIDRAGRDTSAFFFNLWAVIRLFQRYAVR